MGYIAGNIILTNLTYEFDPKKERWPNCVADATRYVID